MHPSLHRDDEPPPVHHADKRPAPLAGPTERDRENARIRREIAQRQEAEYGECLLLALGAFGPGWVPSHRHFLIDRDEYARVRDTAEKPKRAATVFTVRNTTGEKRHFTVENG